MATYKIYSVMEPSKHLPAWIKGSPKDYRPVFRAQTEREVRHSLIGRLCVADINEKEQIVLVANANNNAFYGKGNGPIIDAMPYVRGFIMVNPTAWSIDLFRKKERLVYSIPGDKAILYAAPTEFGGNNYESWYIPLKDKDGNDLWTIGSYIITDEDPQQTSNPMPALSRVAKPKDISYEM